ncbi:UNVERIFIED_CONTAM: hypothetical protein Sangu_3189700 [Sesamum angustifolium]|uniref:Reverse transcriptase domain-containing protein n=1 Tax=Sesamum angustifolium TaxID=2727405 RepID=A0AAW2JMI8_9LAMI
MVCLPLFSTFWPSAQGDVVPCVLALLNNHVMHRSLNETHIVLIPKCRKPESLSQCRPISLCNVLYKIASKSVANRIKPFLETIISPTQAVFVPGQLITDNILVAYELNHFMRNKNWGKMGHVALKLDISKAYDKVEWNFLKHVLLRLEALSSLVGGLEHEGTLQGVSVSRNAPSISHLLFADDTLIFSQASEEAMRGVAWMLEIYTQASGQAINLNKSSVVFSRLPSIVGKSQKAVFSSLRDKVWNRISGQNEKMLSHTRKGMLIKAVLQSIPTYAMGVFCLPKGVLRDIQSLCADFWWHNRGHRRCIRSLGTSYVLGRSKAGWAFGSFMLSTKPCLRNSVGGLHESS